MEGFVGTIFGTEFFVDRLSNASDGERSGNLGSFDNYLRGLYDTVYDDIRTLGVYIKTVKDAFSQKELYLVMLNGETSCSTSSLDHAKVFAVLQLLNRNDLKDCNECYVVNPSSSSGIKVKGPFFPVGKANKAGFIVVKTGSNEFVELPEIRVLGSKDE